jgi:ATP-dependent Clp protease ATP-binding subunit ClpA
MCNKNIAILYATKIENGKSEMTGLCMECAKKLGIPVMDELMKQMDLKPEDIENLTEQMSEAFSDKDMDSESAMMKLLMGGADEMDEDADEDVDALEAEDAYEEDPQATEEETTQESKDKSKKSPKERARKLKNLERFGTNLTERAREGKVDRIIGRSSEIDRVIQILNRRTKNNPVLIGEPGVGKTAIAEGLAVKIAEGNVPEKLQDTAIYLLDLTSIVAGTQFRGQFEGRMKAIITEASTDGNVVLVIDEIHNIMGAGEVHGGVMNAANILKPALAKGEVQIIGATTLEEYRKHIEKDAALERRFQPVIVDEPTISDTIEIIQGIRGYYEDYHKVIISDEVIEAAVRMSERYITDRFLPDKAIDVIDEAGSRVNLRSVAPQELKIVEEQIAALEKDMIDLSLHDDYEAAAKFKMELLKLETQREKLQKHLKSELTLEDVAYVIEAWTKIPVQSISEDEAIKLIELEDRIHGRLVGQNEAVTKISKAIRRSRSGFKNKRRPASFIFVGPTGVGKTELAKTLAREIFGSEEAMIRFDMSEFMEKHTVSKMTGAPPGYIGYDQGGQLTEKVRRKPYSVILLDEIEKAHPDVFNVLLQILEDGRLTDGQGRTVYFENTIIIMTSNAGTSIKSGSIGFSSDQNQKENQAVEEALKNTFRPEFLNRIDDIVIFDRLTVEQMHLIVDIMLEDFKKDAAEKHIQVKISDSLKEEIIRQGTDIKFGARPLRRTIQRLVEDEIAESYIKGNVRDGDSVVLDYNHGKVSILKVPVRFVENAANS